MALQETRVESGLVMGICCGMPQFTVFKGIPYAAPPVGALRWQPPKPPEPWQGFRLADDFGCIAPQVRHREGSLYQQEFFRHPESMSEDCLYLNVWTPAASCEERLPVLFWIHGGALAGGYGFEPEFDGEAYCKQGIIVVTFNYRVGALGFLAHPELSAESGYGGSGNYGHMDQLAALNWVRRNIHAFGGDAQRITIAGQSSGAISAQVLMTSPLSRNCMQGAILQSAGGIWPVHGGHALPLEEAEESGIRFMELLGCSTMEELRQKPWEEIVAAQPMRPYEVRFTTCVDGYLLKDEPVQMALRGEIADIPCMLGNTSVEMPYSDESDEDAFRQKVMAQYGELAEEYLSLVTDADIRCRIGGMAHIMHVANRTYAELMQVLGRKPVWLYYFDKDIPGEDHLGAFHSSELWYMFGTIHRSHRPMDGSDYDLSRAMVRYWSSFVKNGTPDHPELPTWLPCTEEQPQRMELGERIGMMPIEERADQVFTRKFLLGKVGRRA